MSENTTPSDKLPVENIDPQTKSDPGRQRHANSEDPPSLRHILWERTKRPIIFMFVCLAAATVLLWLFGIKKAFDKNQNAPLVVVENKDNSSSPKAISAGRLIDRLTPDLTEINDENPESKKKAHKDLTLIVRRSVADIKFQDFKNEDEFVKTLTGKLSLHKNLAMRDREKKMETEQSKLNDIDDSETKALDQLNTNISESGEMQPVDFKGFQDKIAKKQKESDINDLSALSEALTGIKKSKKADGMHDKSWFEGEIKSFYQKKKEAPSATIESHRKALLVIEDNFVPIVKDAYMTRGDVLKALDISKDGSAAPAQDQRSRLAAFLSDGEKFKSLFFDDKGELNALYKLAEIVLTAALIFGLLYLILIPLKYIFFLGTSADVLTEQAKKLLDRKGPSVGTPFGASVMSLAGPMLITAGALTVGGVVIANAPLPSFPAETGKAVPGIVKQFAPPSNPLPPGPGGIADPLPGGGDGGQTPVDFTELTESLNRLDQTIYNFDGTIETPELKDLPLMTKQILDSIENLNKTMGTPGTTDENTVLGVMKKTSIDLADGNKQFKEQFGSIRDDIGVRPPPGQGGVSANQYLTTSDEDVMNQSLTGENSVPDVPAKPKSIKDVVDSMGKEFEVKHKKTLDEIDEINRRIGKPRKPIPSAKTTSSAGTLPGTTSTPAASTSPGTPPANTVPTPNAPAGPPPTTTNQVSGPIDIPYEETVFGVVEVISKSIGSTNYNDSNSTIFDALGTRDDSFEKKNLVGFAKTITADTSDLGRFLVMESGSSSSFFKRLFQGRQYLLSTFVTAELENRLIPEKSAEDKVTNAPLRSLINALKVILTENKDKPYKMSENKLREKLLNKGIGDDIWEHWKETIFFYSYVYDF